MLMPAQCFNKEFQQNIVQSNTSHSNHKVADQLDSSAQIRPLKDDIHAQVKTNRERDKKSNDERCYMRLEGQHSYLQYLFVQYEIVNHVVEKNIEQCIASTAGCVMISLNGHEPSEQRVEDVQHGKNGFSNAVVYLTHEVTNLNQIPISDGLDFVNRR